MGRFEPWERIINSRAVGEPACVGFIQDFEETMDVLKCQVGALVLHSGHCVGCISKQQDTFVILPASMRMQLGASDLFDTRTWE